jgi:predicted nucleic acid-binding protein
VSFVLDSSATLAWVFQDETHELIGQIFADVAATGALVPALWRLEVANGLRNGLRRRRIDRADRDAALADLSHLRITVDPDTDRLAWSATLSLSDRFDLTTYDAAYLELAHRHAVPLASLDKALCAAARRLAVAVVGD